jgi:hypothetical protein
LVQAFRSYGRYTYRHRQQDDLISPLLLLHNLEGGLKMDRPENGITIKIQRKETWMALIREEGNSKEEKRKEWEKRKN